ncbi:MAG: 3-hydroxybutyryl-CoA dehydrogenase [Clostridiales bacterium]|nr:MAG: 3-hydroxybutyryl-CoA dehydrogenase [Clostridiales bacterium]
MKLGVIGNGTMGVGIIETFLLKGHEVYVKCNSERGLTRAKNALEKSFGRSLSKEKLTQEQIDDAYARLTWTFELRDLRDSELIIEAAVERMDLKKELFAELDSFLPESTILATNTSSLSITEIASATNRPDKVIGMHFFNPVPVLKLVEIICGMATSKETEEKIFEVTRNIGKEPVKVEEAPGFVVNRILIPMINEAIGILADGVAKAEDIDTSMKLGAAHPIGPLALGDLIGLDVCLNIMDVLYNEFCDPKYRAHPLLRKMVRGGLLGRKTKEGFYKY